MANESTELDVGILGHADIRIESLDGVAQAESSELSHRVCACVSALVVVVVVVVV